MAATIDTAGPDAPFDRTAWLPAALQMSDEARDAFYGDLHAEEDRLRAELAKYRNGAEIVDLFDLALETGLRRAKLLGLRVGQVKTVRGVTRFIIPDSKNGEPRLLVLSAAAVAIVARRAEGLNSKSRLFTVSDVVLRRA